MSNSLAACELLGDRRLNYSSPANSSQKFHIISSVNSSSSDNSFDSPPASPMGSCYMAAPGSPASLQLAAAAQNKRKEKARIAARARRSQEAAIIMEMAAELQITQEKLRRIDKATIVKLAMDYMKAFEMLCGYPRPPSAASELPVAPQKLALSLHQQQQQEQQQEQPTKITSNITTNNKLKPIGRKTTTTTRKTKRHQPLEGIEEEEEEEEEITRHNYVEEGEEEQDEEQENNQQQQQQQNTKRVAPLFSAPKLATASIFAPKTLDNMNSHFLMIEEDKHNGKSSFVLKPDTEILDDDDLTHLAPQAGDISISLEADPLDGIPSDDLLMLSPKSSNQTISVFFNCTKAA